MKKVLQDERGVTLIEVIIAVAILAGVVGATAQSLMSFYVSIDVQEQRMEAIRSCQGLMDGIREKRVEFKNDFPDALLTWIETNNDNGWDAFLVDNSRHEELGNQDLTVACFDSDGESAGSGDNPVFVHVTTTWSDRKGRTLEATVVSVLTNE